MNAKFCFKNNFIGILAYVLEKTSNLACQSSRDRNFSVVFN